MTTVEVDGMRIYRVGGYSNAMSNNMMTFLVCKSQNYLVTTPDKMNYTCTCPDCIYRHRQCKHITAVKTASIVLDTIEKISLKTAVESCSTPEGYTYMKDPGGESIEVTLTPDAIEAVKVMEPVKVEPLPEDKYDVKNGESLRKTMIAMHTNKRTEDEAFVKLHGFLRMDGITDENRDLVKEWMALLMRSWDDLMEEIDDGS